MKVNTQRGSMIYFSKFMLGNLVLLVALFGLLASPALAKQAATQEHQEKTDKVHKQMEQRVSTEERKAAADSLKALRQQIHDFAIQKYGFDPREKAAKERKNKGEQKSRSKGQQPKGTLGIAGFDFLEVPTGPFDANGNESIPDYNTTANWAYTPPIAKFVDTLSSSLDCSTTNNLGQCIPIAHPDTVTYPGSDYYEISLQEWNEQMHSDMPLGTPIRGYVQINNGTVSNPANCDPADPLNPSANSCNTLAPQGPHYMGPIIVAQKDRPVRIKFTNNLPSKGNPGLGGNEGDLFIPVDQSVMGAGTGPLKKGFGGTAENCDNTVEGNTCEFYTQNRATIHLHGGRTPWISDGTPHQWITPAGEDTSYPQGVSVSHVPDMPIPQPGDGSMTFYYSNQQTARLMFYHDHAFGITRLNVLAGMAAGYLITDEFEQDLISRNLLPDVGIPLVIQDRTFVDATEVTHPLTGATVPRIRVYDPLWNWGLGTVDANGVRAPQTGELWLPHVYVPAQNPFNPDNSGVNPFGRWLYGPWFYPPTDVTHPPVTNPYYDPDCDSLDPWILADCGAPGQPPLMPATPHPSMGMEAFFDSIVVNGTAFPRLEVEPRPYRFRILNAANDRGLNLSIYKADATPGNTSPVVAGGTLPFSGLKVPLGFDNRTEVKKVPAQPTAGWPELWPTDGRGEGVPDPGDCSGARCSNWGPSWLQIGTDAGFLPSPVVKDPQPITYVTDPTAFWVGVVKDTSLGIMPAERADVIVDFSQYAGETLIVYNDAPTAWPALDFRYDYWTGYPDNRDSGGYGAGGVYNPVTGVYDGGHGILPGFAPNTRTVMQIVVGTSNSVTPINVDALKAEFTTAAATTDANPTGRPLFERAMEPIIVAQPAYDEAYGTSFPTNFPWGGVRYSLDDGHIFNFQTLGGQQVSVKMQPKGIHDEMGASFDPEYGRMSGNLAIELQPPRTNNANLSLYGFSDVPTEIVQNSFGPNVTANQLGKLTDGTQIWNVSHNGVDTHPIHFHIFDVQLISRLGWDNQIALPEANELGWKDTVRISPLMDTIVAVRPVAPQLPFGIPNSLRPLNPSLPMDATMGFSNVDPATGQAYVDGPFANGVTNRLFDFGWEYVWHCHILSHEEMDMMRPIILQVDTLLSDPFALSRPALADAAAAGPYDTDVNTAGVDLSWTDPTAVDLVTGNFGDQLKNEIGYYIWRSDAGTGIYQKVGSALANQTTGKDETPNDPTDIYIIEAYTASGSTYSDPLGEITLTVTPGTGPYAAPANLTLTAEVTAPLAQSVVSVEYYLETPTGFLLLGQGSDINYAFNYNNLQEGSYSIVAVANAEVPDPPTSLTNKANLSAVSTLTTFSVIGFTVEFTANSGLPIGVCDPIDLAAGVPAGGSGPYTYNWIVDGVALPTAGANQNLPAMTPGDHTVTLNVTDNLGAIASTTQTLTVVTQAPIINSNGAPIFDVGGTLTSFYLSDPVLSLPNIMNGKTLPAGTLVMLADATPAVQCPGVPNPLTYAWDLGSNNSYDILGNNKSVKYTTLNPMLGVGNHTITLKVTDSYGAVAISVADLTVNASGPALAAPLSLSVPLSSSSGNYLVSWSAVSGTGVTYTLEESPDHTFTTSTVVASGTTATSQAISGKTAGLYFYRVKADAPLTTTSGWTNGSNACAIGMSITTTALSAGNVGVAYDMSTTPLIGSGGTPAYSWSAYGLPSGLVIDQATGVISGTPLAANIRADSPYADVPVSIFFYDSLLRSAGKVLFIRINAAPVL